MSSESTTPTVQQIVTALQQDPEFAREVWSGLSEQGHLAAVLGENPELLAEARQIILTDEVLQTPGRVGQIETVLEFLRDLIVRGISAQHEFNEYQQHISSSLENKVGVLQRDITSIRARQAHINVNDNAPRIASQLGYLWVTNISAEKRADMVRDVSNVPYEDRAKFVNADLLVEAMDKDGSCVYLAVETAFTAVQEDISKAKSNAAVVAAITEQQAHPVIVSVRLEDMAASDIQRGEAQYIELVSDFMDTR